MHRLVQAALYSIIAAGLVAAQTTEKKPAAKKSGGSSAILHPEMTVAADAGSYDKPMGTLGEKSSDAWSATTVGAGVDKKPQPGKAIAFCGIARSEQFFRQLRSLGADIAESISFPDHHRYGERDINRLLSAQTTSGAQYFVTTEKDEINLGPLADRLQPLVVARLLMTIGEPERLLNLIFFKQALLLPL